MYHANLGIFHPEKRKNDFGLPVNPEPIFRRGFRNLSSIFRAYLFQIRKEHFMLILSVRPFAGLSDFLKSKIGLLLYFQV